MNKLLIFLGLVLLAFFVNSKCIVGTLKCTTCTTDKCTACTTGFYADTAGLCQKCKAGCDACSATACTTLSAGYWDNAGTPTACLSNCLACSSATICTKCKYGFWLKETSADTGLSCTAVSAGCKDAYSEVKASALNVEHCIEPSFGFDGSNAPLSAAVTGCTFKRGDICVVLSSGKFYVDFIKACTVSGCKSCAVGTPGTCTACTDGAQRPKADGSACVAKDAGMTQAIFDLCKKLVTATLSTCAECIDGYFDTDCSACDETNVVTGYTSGCTYCGPNSAFASTDTDDTIDADECLDFGASSGAFQLAKPTTTCKAWTQTGASTANCLVCPDGYGPDSQGLSGAGFDHALCSSRTCATNCKHCEGTATTDCTTPSSGFYLIRKSALTIILAACYEGCTKCTGPYFYDCQELPGYGLATLTSSFTQGTATAIEGCKYYNGAATAVTCLVANEGYFLTTATPPVVTKCDVGCKACSGTGVDKCTTVAAGYFKEGTTAIKACSANCLECTSATVCTKCDEANGFGLDAGACVNQCISNCKTCFSTAFEGCESCKDNFTSDATAKECKASSTTNNTNNTNNTNGTTSGYILSAIAGFLSLILILMF